MPSETFGKFTINGYSTKVTNLTYTPSVNTYTGNLYYFGVVDEAVSLAWTSDLSSNKCFIFAIGGGGKGGDSDGISGGGGGGGGGAYGRADLYSLTPTSPVALTVGDAGYNTEISYGSTTYTFNHGSNGGDAISISGSAGAGGIYNAVGFSYGQKGGDGGSGGSTNGGNGENAYADTQIVFDDPPSVKIYLPSGGGGGSGNNFYVGGNGGGGSGIGGIGGSGASSEDGIRGYGAIAGSGGNGGDLEYGGGGGGGFGGGGGGADGDAAKTGGQGAAGAVFLFIVKPDPPTIPASVATFVTSTDETLTVSGDPTGAEGSPFTSATFTLYEDALGTTPVGSPVLVTTPNGSSGYYEAEFTGLSASTDYWVKWFLTNDGGDGPISAISAPLATIAAVVAPSAAPDTLAVLSRTTTSLNILGNPDGVTGSPSSATFHLYTDASGTIDVSGSPIIDSTIDGSGNYNADFTGLTVNTQYWAKWLLSNAAGPGPASSLTTFYTSPSTPANPPTFVSATALTLTVSGNPTGITPITAAEFNLYSDASGTIPAPPPMAWVQGPDGSGNYTQVFDSLEAETDYWVNWYVSNLGGPGAPSALTPVSTTALPDAPSAPANLPIIVTVTTNSVIVSGNPTDASGVPFTSATFALYSDTSGTLVGETVPDLSADASGNYEATFGVLTAGTQYWVSWFLTNEANSGPESSLVSFTTLAPCFLRGSKILCLKDGKEEYMRIEDMRAGTPVKTLNGTYVKVHTIGKSNYNNPDNADRGPNRLFRLTPSNYPELTEDLIVTGCHSRLVDKLEPKQKARHLQLMKTLYMTTGKFRLMAFIDEKAEPYQNPGKHEIWHFALENEEVVCNYGVYANGGLLVETASIHNMIERSGLVLIE